MSKKVKIRILIVKKAHTPDIHLALRRKYIYHTALAVPVFETLCWMSLHKLNKPLVVYQF